MVDKVLVDVGESAQRTAVVLGVVVQRHLVPQSRECGVEVGADDDVVGVVVNILDVMKVGVGADRHENLPFATTSVMRACRIAGLMSPVCQRARRFGRFVPFA